LFTGKCERGATDSKAGAVPSLDVSTEGNSSAASVADSLLGFTGGDVTGFGSDFIFTATG
jgi:hypothetical protein